VQNVPSRIRTQPSRCATPLVVVALLCLSGCVQLGPTSINRDRFDYGSAVGESWKQQALLNIVKLRYADSPVFVDVAQIVSGYTLQSTLTGGWGYNLGIHGPDSANIGAQAQYTDRPTITYTPLTGQQYMRGIMTPIAPSTVLFMIQSGYAADFVLRMTVESINGLNNRSAAPARRNGGDAEFFAAVDLIRDVQRSGSIGMRIEVDKTKKEVTVMTFPRRQRSAELRAQTAEIGRLLRLEPGADEYKVSYGMGLGGGGDIEMATRSVAQIMLELADTVDVPAPHLAEGSAYPALPPTGGVQPLMRIHSGDARPADAFAAAQYRGSWFWIDQRDLLSKRTLAFLQGIFNYADTGKPENLPLVTIQAQ
jgi:hypothetical protein